jgi:acetyl esterase/lipase
MPLITDLPLQTAALNPTSITPQTHAFNASLAKYYNAGPQWYEISAEKYRQMRWNGETPLPKPRLLDSAKNISLPSREVGRDIPCRVFRPSSSTPDSIVNGLFYHLHGGGWVLQSEAYQDELLQRHADDAGLIVLSVGYRLAPEHPFPAPNEDCVDVGEYLVDFAERDFGVKMKFLGGDSAGAQLSVLTAMRLLETRREFEFNGVCRKRKKTMILLTIPHLRPHLELWMLRLVVSAAREAFQRAIDIDG